MNLKTPFAVLILCFMVSPLLAQSSQDFRNVEQEARTLLSAVDNTEGDYLQDQDFIVTIYQQILGRDPSQEELITAEALLKGREYSGGSLRPITIPRSQLVALLLAKKENVSDLSWDIMSRDISLLRSLDIKTVPEWKVSRLSDDPVTPPAKKLSLKAHRDQYQLYYGYMHSHTSYSDGEGTPEEAYKTARDVAKLDYFTLTDHGELLLIWPWNNKWNKTKAVAQSFNQDNVFVALHGFEWSSPILGHICVVNSDDFTNCIFSFTVKSICTWISERPNAIARFNHPGSYNIIGLEFDKFKLYPFAVENMTGIEMYNGNSGVRTYFYKKGYYGVFNYMDEANRIGWRLSSLGGDDSHNKTWGIMNDYIIGVWATSLTRQGILEAHRERRTFASEDRNLGMSFKMDGAEMGSRLTPGQKNITFNLWDRDGEAFTEASIYKSGVLLKTFQINSTNPNIQYTVDAQAGDYYYLLVTQTDGDMAISSPIWIE